MSCALNHKKLFISIILLLIICIGLLYCYTSNSWFQKQYPITVAVSKTPLSSPFYVAKAINAFDETCVRVEYNEVIGGQAAFNQVINDAADFGTSSDSVIAFASLTEQAFVTHAMFSQSDNDVKLITRTADEITSIIGLQGKRIGVIKRTASEYLLSMLLAFEGLSVDDVDLYYYNPDELLPVFIDNKIDAMVLWEPYAYQALNLLGKKIKTHDTKNLSTLSFSLISKTPDQQLIDKTVCLIHGLQKAINFIASNPKKAKNIIIKELKLETAFIEWVWPDYIFKLGLNQSLILSIQSQATWAVESQLSEYTEAPNAIKYVDTRALLQIDPGAVNITN